MDENCGFMAPEFVISSTFKLKRSKSCPSIPQAQYGGPGEPPTGIPMLSKQPSERTFRLMNGAQKEKILEMSSTATQSSVEEVQNPSFCNKSSREPSTTAKEEEEANVLENFPQTVNVSHQKCQQTVNVCQPKDEVPQQATVSCPHQNVHKVQYCPWFRLWIVDIYISWYVHLPWMCVSHLGQTYHSSAIAVQPRGSSTKNSTWTSVYTQGSGRNYHKLFWKV